MTQQPFPGGRVFTLKEAAALLKVSVATVKNYIYQRKIQSIKTPGGHHRVPESQLLALWREIAASQPEPVETAMARPGRQVEEVKQAVRATIHAFVKALDMRDTFVAGHAGRVSRYCLALAKRVGLSEQEQEQLELAALLHDVGKVAISEAILRKAGKLNTQEYATMQRHPELGEHIVAEVEWLKGTQSAIRHHHERYDGHGYPHGLAKDQIPLTARIIAVAETFDALTSRSAYREPLSPKQAYRELKRVAGTQLDPQLVSQFTTLQPLKNI